jgi:hypothetical protein
MISFYTPSDAFARSERGLVQLRQLHTDLAIFVANNGNICDPLKGGTEDPKAKGLKDLSTRLTEIINASGTGGQPAQSGTGQTGAR